MTGSRLRQLYEIALRREKRPQAVTETPEEQTRRVMLAAVRQQQAEIDNKKSTHTRYVKD